jgi:predicted membrane-bound mannosyltransferase
VLPFDLPDESACWVFTAGVVPVQTDAAVTVGDLLVQGASGIFTNTGATVANATAVAAETTAAAGISAATLVSGKFI